MGRTRLCAVLGLFAMLAAITTARAEDWPGYDSGGSRHDSSIVAIDPAALQVVWQRAFTPVRMKNGNVTIGSRNLVCVGGKLAILQPTEAGFPQERRLSLMKDRGDFDRGYVSILDAASGKTINCIAVVVRDGQRHNYWYPTGLLVDAADTVGGHHVLHWDAQSGILFLRSGGDGCFATAYRPLANLDGYRGGWQEGVAAFAAGRSVPQWKKEPWLLAPDEWSPVRPNDTSFFQVDVASPMLVVTGGNGHNQCRAMTFTDKNTGMPLDAKYTQELKPVNDPPLPKGDATKTPQPFAKWASVIVDRGRVYFLAAGDDNDADGVLGSACLCADSMTAEAEREKDRAGKGSARWKADNPDQGLHLCAYDYKYVPGEKPALTLTPAFIYRFVSPHKPALGPADCESYLETDHFYRNKAILSDDGGVWAVWQKSSATGAELIHADKDGAKTWPLGICKGVRGQDVWPHFALAEIKGGKYLVYYAGNAYRQDYLPDKPPYRPVDCFGPQREPGGPAQLAVFDIRNGKVAYTFDLSAAYPSLPPNLAQHYLDRSQMVVAGGWAYVAWIDLTGDKAQLRLLGFDVTASATHPVEKVFPLDFDSAKFPKSMLTDLIAVDGRLYALVTQASKLAPNVHMFEFQQIVALGGDARK